MIYFVPSWYLKDEFKEVEQFWYSPRTLTETDDTVKQIQLFHRNSICDYEIMLLSYAPNFRHFLHRQSVYRAKYWSVFDAMQDVHRKKQGILSIHNLKWPKNVEFIYTPFCMVAMIDNKKYAQVEYGEYGNPIQINLYQDEALVRKNIYDDRGFVSCSITYEDGKESLEQYLSENGVWVLNRHTDGRVEVNPNNNHFVIEHNGEEKEYTYSKLEYDSIEEVIKEVLTEKIAFTQKEDIFCIAFRKQHNSLLNSLLIDRKIIYSVFGQRAKLTKEAAGILSSANYIVTDSEDNNKIVNSSIKNENTKIVNIPPYDTRVDFGISQKLHVQKILLPVDQLDVETFDSIIKNLASYLLTNKDARVHLFTRRSAYNREDYILGLVRDALAKYDYPVEWARKENKNKFEFSEDEEHVPILFTVEQCVNELAVNICVREQRVLLDLAEVPDLFLQISCVSMGIPQILKKATQYMEPGKNGIINEDFANLSEDLKYYLENLSNWNKAVVNSYHLGKQHTTEYLINSWKKVIEDLERA